MDIHAKREHEKRIVTDMIHLYCRHHHTPQKDALCPECRKLQEYAVSRSDACPFMEQKTFCSNCRVHCYSPQMQNRIRIVMRYSGPRMIFIHPITAVRHLIASKTEKRRLKQHRNDTV